MSKAAAKDRNMSHTGDTSLPHCAEHQITEVLLTTRPLLSPNRFLQDKLQNVHEATQLDTGASEARLVRHQEG
eukprot:g55189.t1